MGDILASLRSLLDFQKTAPITVPGATLAVALILLNAPPEKLTFIGYDMPSDPKLHVPPACDALSREDATESGDSGRMSIRDYRGIQSRRWQIESCVRGLQILVINEEQARAAVIARINAESSAAEDFSKKYQSYSDEASDLAISFMRQRDATLGVLAEARRDSTQGAIRTTFYQNLLNRWTAEQALIVTRLKTVNSWDVFSDIATKLTQKAILFSAAAIALGLLLTPLNNALIANFYDDEKRARLNLRTFRKGWPPVSDAKEREDKPWLNPNYAVGMELVTQPDIDNIRNNYRTKAELSMGMIVPVMVLLMAGTIYTWEHFPDSGMNRNRTTEEAAAILRHTSGGRVNGQR